MHTAAVKTENWSARWPTAGRGARPTRRAANFATAYPARRRFYIIVGTRGRGPRRSHENTNRNLPDIGAGRLGTATTETTGRRAPPRGGRGGGRGERGGGGTRAAR